MSSAFVSRLLGRLALLVPGGDSIRPKLHRLRGARIGRNVWISQFVYIDELHPEAVAIGDNCTIGLRTSIFTHFYWGPRRSSGQPFKAVVIEDDVFVGPHCLLLPGVRIGRGSIVKGGSVITRSVPAGIFWGPPPSGPLSVATVPLTSAHTYEEFVAGLKPLPSRKPPS